MLYIIHQIDKPDAADVRAAHREAHFAYLDEHKDILVLGGAMLAEDGVTRTGSVLIINVPNREAAEAFSANEPFRKAVCSSGWRSTGCGAGSGTRMPHPRRPREIKLAGYSASELM